LDAYGEIAVCPAPHWNIAGVLVGQGDLHKLAGQIGGILPGGWLAKNDGGLIEQFALRGGELLALLVDLDALAELRHTVANGRQAG
jgi:hypothetical protein